MSGFSVAAAASVQQKPVKQTSSASLLFRSAERKMHSKVVSKYPALQCFQHRKSLPKRNYIEEITWANTCEQSLAPALQPIQQLST